MPPMHARRAAKPEVAAKVLLEKVFGSQLLWVFLFVPRVYADDVPGLLIVGLEFGVGGFAANPAKVDFPSHHIASANLNLDLLDSPESSSSSKG